MIHRSYYCPRARPIARSASLVTVVASLLVLSEPRVTASHEMAQPRALPAASHVDEEAPPCVAKRFPCARLGDGCSRPPKVFFFKLRGTGNKMFGEGVLNHLFLREQMDVDEGWTVAHHKTMAKIRANKDAGGLLVSIFRDPIDRILSRYWFEGRWPLFKSHQDLEAVPFGEWLNRSREHCSVPSRRERVWDCSENYYVKSFAGWAGTPMCDEGLGRGCFNGVGPKQLEKAKQLIATLVDVPLVVEWMSSPRQRQFVARQLCYENTNGVGPLRKSLVDADAEEREVPSYKPKRPGGGHSSMRPAGWQPDPEHLAALHRANAYDVQLYEWVKNYTFAKMAPHRRLQR